MATHEVAQSVPASIRRKAAHPRASCWRAGSKLYGDNAVGPYVVTKRRDGRWLLWWQDGEVCALDSHEEAAALLNVCPAMSAKDLQRRLGVTYKCAWRMRSKLASVD